MYATDKQMLVAKTDGTFHLLEPRPFLPLWSHPKGTSFLMLAPGRQEWTFDLLRMQISKSH
jgi:hypothetical protein